MGSRMDHRYCGLFLAWAISLMASFVDAMEYYSYIGSSKAAGPSTGNNIDVLSSNLQTGSTPTMFVSDTGTKVYRVVQLQITPGSPSTVAYNFVSSQTYTTLISKLWLIQPTPCSKLSSMVQRRLMAIF